MAPLGSIPVIFSEYASSEPKLVPGVGVVCKDKESLLEAPEEETAKRVDTWPEWKKGKLS